MKNKLTIEDIEAVIEKEEYFHIGKKTTVCLLTLKNGFETTGTAGVIDPTNYKKEIGEKVARENAVHSIWLIEGYLLQEKLK